MDEKWFKKQQRKAGVTADEIAAELGRDRSLVSRLYVGRQRMTLDQARAFSKVLAVPLEEVLSRAGVATPEEAPRLAPGYSDGDAVQLPSMRPGSADAKAAQCLGGGREGVDVWQVTSNCLLFKGFKSGDLMLVDMQADERARLDDIVLAQVFDHNSGKPATVLRLYQPPILIGAGPDDADNRAYLVDGSSVVIRGKVIASWRTMAA